MVARPHPYFSVVQQCQLLKVPRSTFYYDKRPASADDLALMRRIDELYLKWPFYGSRRMVAELRGEGYEVNRKRIRRLMRLMGIEAIYQKPNTSRKHPSHKIYPYLLKNPDDRPCQSSLVRRHHLHSHGTRMGLPGRCHGLVQPARVGMAPVDHDGDGLLR